MNLFVKIFGVTQTSPMEAIQFHPTDTCQECGSKLAQRNGDIKAWQCPNQDCPAMLRERLVHWCSPGAMDIPEIDAALVATLVSKGLAYDPAELYRLKLKELAALEGMDAARAQKIFDSITASQKRDGWRLLYGLSIPLVGEAEAQALALGFTSADAVFAAGVAQLVSQGGISEAVSQSLARWYFDGTNRKLVKRLAKAGVNFEFRK